MQERGVPLCVDLDGTLIRSDLLVESTLDALRRNPWLALRLTGWLWRGRAHLKRQVAARADIDVALLPYDARIVEWLHGQAGQRRLLLCTAADQQLAECVASHVGGFDEVLGSDGVRNFDGARKAERLAERFGEGGFDYIGNSHVDFPVWRRARRVMVANARDRLLKRAQSSFDVAEVFRREQGTWRDLLVAMRPHQWLKNVLVFLPLLAAHMALLPNAVLRAGAAFIAFGLCASGAYLVNDLLDLEADRRHPRKRLRPFAAGTLPIGTGLAAALALTLTAFVIAVALSPGFALVLGGYCVLTLAYSLSLKRIAMLDVVTLAALYTIRIVAGTVAIRVAPSFWLLAFSMFLFLSLAMIKRYTELRGLRADGQTIASGRGYTVDDLPLVQSLGAASGYLSVLVLALYINSTASEALYRHPLVLWLLCPLLLYWISRAWLISHRDGMHDDPVVFALTDSVSRAVLVACAAVALLAL